MPFLGFGVCCCRFSWKYRYSGMGISWSQSRSGFLDLSTLILFSQVSLCFAVLLCILVCLAFLASTHKGQQPITLPPTPHHQLWQLKMSSDNTSVSWEAKPSHLENDWLALTPALACVHQEDLFTVFLNYVYYKSHYFSLPLLPRYHRLTPGLIFFLASTFTSIRFTFKNGILYRKVYNTHAKPQR